uniref:Cathepsin L n=1 Tax=Clastoptera arizonana TaxID=38151 RepID=A0A1B6CUB5_9HEMI
MMLKLVCIFAVVTVFIEAHVFSDVLLKEWEAYKLEYNKKYSTTDEDKSRMNVFTDNKIKILKHNLLFYKGIVSYKMGLNNFSDMYQHEILRRKGYNPRREEGNSVNSSSLDEEEASYYIEPENVVLPASVDWRTKGAVTDIKDQGDCGSCWAFSATGSLEGQHFRKIGTLVSLSEQNLLDCSWKFGDQGCNGGLMDDAFKYVKANHGIDTETSYPYRAMDGACKYRPNTSGCNCTGYVDIPTGSEAKLQAAVATIGPVSVAIDASLDSFMNYRSGIYYDAECSSEFLDHGVLVVGYGTSPKGQDYWIVKNSWGTSWGNNGYILMSRNKHNNCGIATAASYPLV